MKPIKNRNIPDISGGDQFPGIVLFSKSARCKPFPRVDGFDSFISFILDIRDATYNEIEDETN